MAVITPTVIGGFGDSVIDLLGGLVAAADLSNEFLNSSDIVWVIENGDASPHTLTIVSAADQYGRTGDHAMVIAAGDIGISGFLPESLFDSPCVATLDAITSVNLGALRFEFRGN